jgi:hypothetical protein
VTPEEIAELIAALDLDRTDVVTGAILIAKVKDMETSAVGISISATDDVEWVGQLGIIEAAKLITTRNIRSTLEGD